MSKVLSTKLALDEVDRFNAAAGQQGLSKAGLLKHLVKEYLGGRNEESKASTNSKHGDSSSLEQRQTPEERNGESTPLEKPKVLQNGKLEKCLYHVNLDGRKQNVAQCLFTDGTPTHISSTIINSQGKASLAKAPDSKEIITKVPSVEQGFLKVEARTQANPKIGFGELLFFSLMALGIVLSRKRNSNQKILSEPNYSGYPDYNEVIATAYRDLGLPYL